MSKVLQNGKQAANVLHKTDMHQAPWVTQAEDDTRHKQNATLVYLGRLKWYFALYMFFKHCIKSKNTAEKPKETNPCKTQISTNCTYIFI